MNIKEYADKSVLCWLATVDADLMPNVSPKEIFIALGDNKLLIANVASPISEKNIRANNKVCVSFIEVFEQRGFKVKGMVRVIDAKSPEWTGYLAELRKLADERYPIKNIFEVNIESSVSIIAPSYFLFSETTPESQVEGALSAYKVSR
ncbi:pyridoxamine 5'-phosphate oxidase family protein [Grimontia sp. NTOU-MAR1]|uniref:pyridoxamine 5'-phosphate oxidase family protein n=1 Tax=Grimontia sp. NTOU-MAR1 TaxID=3111011 RepID=UPI002DB84A1F|nr:pyridoxamine 5'-phosphate oxidase family protein [Grimontia sp. NTOU-MAR1]WRW00904.1 pyridoxamine 5'-phosphate oxidase family protein [Grimontia sp. NTOU-MAR1]